MSKTKSRNHIKWAVYPFAIWFLVSFYVIFKAILSGQYTLTQYLVEYGDSFSAILTAITILILFDQMAQSDKDRLQTLQELEKDRKLTLELHQLESRRTRIKEKLEFYAPLIGRCLRFDFDETEPRAWLNEVTLQCKVNEKYQLYAEPATKEAFRQYFSGELRGSGNWKDIREQTKEAILSDYAVLITEFETLH